MTKAKQETFAELQNKIAHLAETKRKLAERFDDGDITAFEYSMNQDKLHTQEIYLIFEKEMLLRESRNHVLSIKQMRLLLGLLVGVCFLGFFISPYVYPKIFGYSFAEECILNAKHQWSVGACLDLYPSKSADIPKQSGATVDSRSSEDIHARNTPLADTPLILTDLSTQSTKHINEPWPSNGEIVWYGDLKVGIAPFEIKSSFGSNYFLKLADANTGEDVMGIFVTGGSSLNMKVPLGTYTVKYATGDKWYDYDKYFGQDTIYTKADGLFNFRNENDKVTGYKVTLYSVKNGNLKTMKIQAKDF